MTDDGVELDPSRPSGNETTSTLIISNQLKGTTHIPAASSSCCYEGEKLRESLVSSQVDNMLEFLSKKKDLRLINQQRYEADLTSEQQLDKLHSLFDSNPVSFLQRFGTHLEPVHLDCFSNLKGLNPEKNSSLKFHLIALENSLKTANKSVLIKNRRYEALQKLVDTTNYFTEEEMQRRNPILFEQLIGRYHTKEEREAFLQLSQASSTTSTPLSDMLMAHMTRLDGNVSDRRQEQEMQIDEEEAADEEYLETDMDEDDLGYHSSTRAQKSDQTNDDDEVREEIDEEEKDMLKEEFFTSMYRSFLEGKDDDFDYSTVDSNEEYDCGEIVNQDAEDNYFDAEESQSYTCSSGLLQDSRGCDDDESVCTMISPNSTHTADESEDELDIYMRTIEKQL